jgi:hypothetical protein
VLGLIALVLLLFELVLIARRRRSGQQLRQLAGRLRGCAPDRPAE